MDPAIDTAPIAPALQVLSVSPGGLYHSLLLVACQDLEPGDFDCRLEPGFVACLVGSCQSLTKFSCLQHNSDQLLYI